MSWTKNVWRTEVAGYLFELANINFQKELWLGNISGFESDFSDLINGLEECGIPDSLSDFIDDGYLKKAQSDALRSLDKLINETGEYSSAEEFQTLWGSQLWGKISVLAGQLFADGFIDDFKKGGSSNIEWFEKWPIPTSK